MELHRTIALYNRFFYFLFFGGRKFPPPKIGRVSHWSLNGLHPAAAPRTQVPQRCSVTVVLVVLVVPLSTLGPRKYHPSPREPALSLPVQPAVESAVTRLLVAIKQLLESLTMWSNLQLTEAQISDVYVRLGNDFNAAVAAFAAFDIDMRCAPLFMHISSCNMPSLSPETSCPSPKTYVTSSKLVWLKTQHPTIWRFIYPRCAPSSRAYCKAFAPSSPCIAASCPNSIRPDSVPVRPTLAPTPGRPGRTRRPGRTASRDTGRSYRGRMSTKNGMWRERGTMHLPHGSRPGILQSRPNPKYTG